MNKISLTDDREYLKFILSDPVGWICMKICLRLYPDEFPKEDYTT